MPEKKPYSAPQLVQVALNHEQAILAQCSTTVSMTSSAGTFGVRRCRTQNPKCKKKTSPFGTNDSSGRPS